MKILGLHHITLVTNNAQHNVDFYVGVLGLRFIKKTVNGITYYGCSGTTQPQLQQLKKEKKQQKLFLKI